MDPDLPVITRVAEYTGGRVVAIAPTQQEVTAAEARRILDDWIAFFDQGPAGMVELEFRSRTPARLVEALRSQTQLERLELKWGDYADLTVFEEMTRLAHLTLGGAVRVTSLDALAGLPALRRLVLDATQRATDYAPIGMLHGLRELVVVSGFSGPRLHAESAAFVSALTELRALRWTPIVDSGDYSPFLALTHVEDIWITPARHMSPEMAELEAALPALARERRAATDLID